MRILAVAAFSVPYIWENFGEPLKHLYGDDVICVNANPFLAHFNGAYLESYLYGMVARQHFDYLFFYHDWIYADFSDEFFVNLRSAGVRTATFHPDDEPEVWYGKNILYDHRYDLVVSHSRNGVDRRAEEGFDRALHYMQWGYNPRFLAPLEEREKCYDVVFVGKNKIYEHDDSHYREDGRNRDEALFSLARICEARGWVFRLFGFGWERHPELARFAGGVLSRDEMVEVFNRSRVVFSPAWSSDDRCRVAQTKFRHFEVAGCGAFQVVNWNEELANFFVADEEIVFYRDEEELAEKVSYYLTHEKERCAVARAGWSRASREHTQDQRLAALFAEMTRLWPPFPPERVARQGRVMTYRLDGRDGATALLERLRCEPGALDGYDGVHFLAGTFDVDRLEYGALSPFLIDGRFPLVGVRCFFDIRGHAANPVQPTREESRGELLSEEIQWEQLQSMNRGVIRDSMDFFEGDGVSFALSNFVVRPDVAGEFLEAFVCGSVERLLALRPFNTGIVVAELSVDGGEGAVAAPEFKGPLYVQMLSKVLEKAERLGLRVVVYGGRGEMARWTLTTAARFPQLDLAAIVDNGLVGQTMGGVPIVGHDSLEELKPDLIIIAAAYSGPGMYERVKGMRGRTTIVPLYDRNDPVWGTLLP